MTEITVVLGLREQIARRRAERPRQDVRAPERRHTVDLEPEVGAAVSAILFAVRAGMAAGDLLAEARTPITDNLVDNFGPRRRASRRVPAAEDVRDVAERGSP
jgi:hypothetical protein